MGPNNLVLLGTHIDIEHVDTLYHVVAESPP